MKLVTYPSPVLNQGCEYVDLRTPEVRHDVHELFLKMLDVMYTEDGVGLAAPQVGLLKRIILVDPSAGVIDSQLTMMVNPKITWTSDERETVDEGCLSVPGVMVPVLRSLACDVEYDDVSMFGQGKQTIRCTGLKARIIQHEVDHLDGVLMIDRVGPLVRREALKGLA